MNEHVHKFVNEGAAANDQILLTDHGPKHINTVIQRIGELTLKSGQWIISPYEAYLLACAAHFHDLGNAFGRSGHERSASSVLFGLDESIIGTDTAEKRLIRDIARVHGGTTESGDKDTIENLQGSAEIKKLAAILRFADELSDDHTRTGNTAKEIMERNIKLKKASEVFHAYADRLRTVSVNHETRTVSLFFELLLPHFKKMYWKAGTQVYLLDEIYERTLKTHCEQIYCAKFMLPSIMLERTHVNIDICSERYENITGTISYVLEQKGYPSHIQSIAQQLPELETVTGEAVAPHIEQLCKGGHSNLVDRLREEIKSNA